jgi:hypothetical protein
VIVALIEAARVQGLAAIDAARLDVAPPADALARSLDISRQLLRRYPLLFDPAFNRTPRLRHYFPGYFGSSDHWRQFEVGATAAGVYTMPADATLKTDISKFTVEGCKRGGVFQPSSCTSWSPTVTVDPR